MVALLSEQQPRAAQREAAAAEREAGRKIAMQREAEVEEELREVQKTCDQMAAKASGVTCDV